MVTVHSGVPPLCSRVGRKSDIHGTEGFEQTGRGRAPERQGRMVPWSTQSLVLVLNSEELLSLGGCPQARGVPPSMLRCCFPGNQPLL